MEARRGRLRMMKGDGLIMAFNSVKERLEGLRRNKRALGCIGAILAIALASGALFRSKGAGDQDAEVSVRSAVAEKGKYQYVCYGNRHSGKW